MVEIKEPAAPVSFGFQYDTGTSQSALARVNRHWHESIGIGSSDDDDDALLRKTCRAQQSVTQLTSLTSKPDIFGSELATQGPPADPSSGVKLPSVRVADNTHLQGVQIQGGKVEKKVVLLLCIFCEGIVGSHWMKNVWRESAMIELDNLGAHIVIFPEMQKNGHSVIVMHFPSGLVDHGRMSKADVPHIRHLPDYLLVDFSGVEVSDEVLSKIPERNPIENRIF